MILEFLFIWKLIVSYIELYAVQIIWTIILITWLPYQEDFVDMFSNYNKSAKALLFLDHIFRTWDFENNGNLSEYEDPIQQFISSTFFTIRVIHFMIVKSVVLNIWQQVLVLPSPKIMNLVYLQSIQRLFCVF